MVSYFLSASSIVHNKLKRHDMSPSRVSLLSSSKCWSDQPWIHSNFLPLRKQSRPLEAYSFLIFFSLLEIHCHLSTIAWGCFLMQHVITPTSFEILIIAQFLQGGFWKKPSLGYYCYRLQNSMFLVHLWKHLGEQWYGWKQLWFILSSYENRGNSWPLQTGMIQIQRSEYAKIA